jgi:SNF2 family DNA or RNA helicase
MAIYPPSAVPAAAVLDHVPGALLVNGATVAVPFTLPNMQIACTMGLPAVSPMVRHYDWPIHPGLEPMAHQKQMAAFMTLHPRCFNLSDMRTGKTLAALWAYDYLRLQGLVKKCLVIAKLSTLERVWLRELTAHLLGRVSGLVLQGTRDQREALLDTRDVDVYIINYDGVCLQTQRGHHGLLLGPLARRLVEREDISCVILDESATLRNSGTQRWKVVRQVVANKPYVWQLTGTPTPNAPTDAHAQKRLVYPVEPWRAFRARTMVAFGPFKWVAQKGAAKEVAKFLQPAIRFERADVMELPPLVYDPPIEVPLTAQQIKLIREMKAELQIRLEEGTEITAVNEAGLRIKLIQILCGAVYDHEHVAHQVDASPRLEMLREVIEEAGGKCLVFAPLTSVVNVLYRELRHHKLTTALITGATSAKERNDIFRRFTDDIDPRILVADPGTVAHGLDLSAANTIIWFAPTDRVEDYQQANQRIAGPRQRRGMLIVRLASTSIERTIYQRLDAKQSLQGVILDLVKEGQ